MTYDGTITSIRLDGGLLCLDFVNSVDDRTQANLIEFYHTYDELLAWAIHAGAIEPDLAQALGILAEHDPQTAAQVYEASRAIREELHALFVAAERGEEVDSAFFVAFNTALSHALGHAQIVPTGEGYGWHWTQQASHPAGVLWPVLRSAADLLTGPDLYRVKSCPRCGWLFLDTSKNRSRRWCSMEICGNRAKAERFYHRERGGEVDT